MTAFQLLEVSALHNCRLVATTFCNNTNLFSLRGIGGGGVVVIESRKSRKKKKVGVLLQMFDMCILLMPMLDIMLDVIIERVLPCSLFTAESFITCPTTRAITTVVLVFLHVAVVTTASAKWGNSGPITASRCLRCSHNLTAQDQDCNDNETKTHDYYG